MMVVAACATLPKEKPAELPHRNLADGAILFDTVTIGLSDSSNIILLELHIQICDDTICHSYKPTGKPLEWECIDHSGEKILYHPSFTMRNKS